MYLLKDADIITVLSNLLDNAIEASEKCEKETPLIKVKLTVENGKLLLAVNNVWNGEIKLRDGKLVSTKKMEVSMDMEWKMWNGL